MIASLPQTVTPLGIISLVISAIVAPITGWLVKNGTKLLKKYTLVNAKVVAIERGMKYLEDGFRSSDKRLSKVEDAIVAFEKAQNQACTQHEAVMGRLEQLPRLAALLEAYSSAIAAIVPRNEVQSNLSSIERRLHLLETDIRK